MIEQACLKDRLHYDPHTGIFRWRFSAARRIKPWDIAGCHDGKKYIVIKFFGRLHGAHRLAWLYMTGEWPKNEVDHIDGIPDNNSFANLREATHKQNLENVKLSARNTSGYRGVTWCKYNKKWAAQVKHNGKKLKLGYFKDIEKAAEVAAAKRKELYTHDIGRDSIKA